VAKTDPISAAIRTLHGNGYGVLTPQAFHYYTRHLKNARRRYLYARKKKQAGGSRG